jgi:hypothetical protein
MNTTHQTLDRTFVAAIAAQMPDWELREETTCPTDPDHALVYIGTNPAYQGAAIYAYGDIRNNQMTWHCNLRIPEGAGKGRFFITHALPYAEYNAMKPLTVNIGVSKAPAVVARELARRLLPRYLALYAFAMAHVHAKQTQRAMDEALAAELATILGCPVRCVYNDKDQPPVLDSPAGSLTIEHGRMRFMHTLSLSPEQARQFCTLMATWQTKA